MAFPLRPSSEVCGSSGHLRLRQRHQDRESHKDLYRIRRFFILNQTDDL
ncbi:hypothetical protein MTBLM1_80126 [Rhodospirillaceae bacterium LM-1]|nr:hypothetical protein MTBLM1_80126 [Rhodospirillaceae bacterium LM-1]